MIFKFGKSVLKLTYLHYGVSHKPPQGYPHLNHCMGTSPKEFQTSLWKISRTDLRLLKKKFSTF